MIRTIAVSNMAVFFLIQVVKEQDVAVLRHRESVMNIVNC